MRNTTVGAVERDVAIDVSAAGETGSPVFQRVLEGIKVPPGNSLQTLEIAVPRGQTLVAVRPNLYVCRVRVLDGGVEEDAFSRNFGFRSFTLDDIGRDARLRLNGDRVFLLTAISWGYWPVTGLIPTPEMAAKQVRTAKELGLTC